MSMVGLRERGPDEDIGVSSRLWIGILSILFFGFSTTVYIGYHVTNNIAQTGRESLDNRTWVFAQLEVDYLRFETALHQAIDSEPLTPETLKPALRLFDIYYSRVDTIQAGKSLFEADKPGVPAVHESISRTVRHRDDLADMIDRLDTPQREDLLNILTFAKEVVPTLRDVTTSALMQLTRQYSDTRRSEETAMARFLVLSTVQALVLFSIAIVAIRLAIKLRTRAAAMKRLGDSFKTIVEASLDGIVLLSLEGRVLGYNTAAAEIFDCQDESILEQTLQDVALPRLRREAFKSDPAAFMTRALDVLSIRGRHRTRLETSRGQSFNAEVALARHEDTFGRSIIIAFVRDLKDIVAHENDLKQARDKALQAMSAKERFLNLMSHELKTPLHGVIASLDLLEGTEVSSDDRENLQIARDSAAAALAQVEDVLAIKSNEAGTPDTRPKKPFDPVDVTKLVVGQARLKARDKDVTVAYKVTKDHGGTQISGRPEAFRRAVANLVDNAVKFTESGSIDVHLTYWQDETSDSWLTVKVSDTGPGIAQEVQEIAFADFQTVSEGDALEHVGNGLGLGIATRAVARMGGTLRLDSRVNEGSHFSFDIPAPSSPDSRPVAVVANTKENPASLQRITVCAQALVVDDNAANRILMQKMLERLGYSVQCAENGEQGIEMADARRFALILMDIQMPGLDGFETALAIRSGGFSRDAVILAVTANLASHDAERFKESGMQEMLAKPLTVAQLSDKVSLYTEEPEAIGANLPDGQAVEGDDQFLISAKSGNLSLISESMESDEFKAWLDACFDEIRGALEAAADNGPDIDQTIHKAAGTAAFIGLPNLQAAMNRMEEALAQTEMGPFKSAHAEAMGIFQNTRVDLSGVEASANRGETPLNL
jgi:PAS domain S-box-containing protein